MAKLNYVVNEEVETTDRTTKISVGGSTIITSKQPKPQIVTDDSNTGSSPPEELEEAPPV